MSVKYLSLCIPTNGIVEWVVPVINSIYSQNVDKELFEVVVSDNGNNKYFESCMLAYKNMYSNFVYSKNTSYLFNNQLEVLKLASGEYLKFINHRTVINDGMLIKLINVIKDYYVDKPVIFFSNGYLRLKEDCICLNSFDLFVRTLKKECSHTIGVGIWRRDYNSICSTLKVDKISPHSCILFGKRNQTSYVINNEIFFREIDHNHKNKGKYDLYKTFAVDEISIILNLLVDGDVTKKTFIQTKNDYKKFVKYLYMTFNLRKEPCSYILTGFNESMGIFMNKYDVIFSAYLYLFFYLIKKLLKFFLKKLEII